ncbi:MAG TPA: response regulator [Tepidisphaeraceae bacterium]|nr:response regulator [Tepidisphaeraceae bacterium]
MDEPKVNILLVDDKPEKLLSLEVVLEDLHQNIVRAYSGREALRALLNQEFAVILLDVNMPGMDGFETASLIRQRKSSEHTPIIFVTAFGDDTHSAQGYQLGAVDYILTPVVPEVLRSKVAVFVDLFKKTQQVQRQAESLRRRATQLQKLAQASLAINSALSTERMLQTITDTARDIVGSHQAITLFIQDAGSDQRAARTRAVTSFSERFDTWRGRELELSPIARSSVAQSRTATRLTTDQLHAHADWEIVRRLDIPPIRGGMLAAPLTGRDGTNLGVIYLSDRCDGRDFSSDDEAVLVQLAQMASIAIENTIYAEEREANRIKDEFLSTLSHELRTPLNAILGWTQLLRAENLTDETKHGLDVIERNAKAQTKLVEDMLDVSRVSSGKLRLNVRPLNLRPLIEAAIEGVRPAAEAKNIHLAFADARGAESENQITGDPDRLQQVAWNLLTNAVKFTPTGGRVTVRLACKDNSVQFQVTDNGVGINRKFLPHVFDRFRQADSTSTRNHGGLGIGLTIVRHIVELHGGTVAADSAGEGRGATFSVLLPIAAARSEPPAPKRPPHAQAAAGGKPGETTDLTGVDVLVVDDEPDAAEVLARVLTRAGATVVTSGSTDEALEQFHRARPHVLVSDIAMSVRDGYDLIRSIRELPADQGGEIPAIAVTAYAREEDRIRALNAGFQIHLAKPVEPAALTAAIAHLAGQAAPLPLKVG